MANSPQSRSGKTLSYYKARDQCIIILLAALKDLGDCRTKRETVQYIREMHWFDVQEDDLLPYPSATLPEPRWQCLIAWARKDALLNEWLFDHDERDAWQITRDGSDCFSRSLLRFRDGQWNAGKCFLWTGVFKRRMCPAYIPSDSDEPRPYKLYKDLKMEKFFKLLKW